MSKISLGQELSHWSKQIYDYIKFWRNYFVLTFVRRGKNSSSTFSSTTKNISSRSCTIWKIIFSNFLKVSVCFILSAIFAHGKYDIFWHFQIDDTYDMRTVVLKHDLKSCQRPRFSQSFTLWASLKAQILKMNHQKIWNWQCWCP